jgi:DNA-binding transcriptional MerR regulator
VGVYSITDLAELTGVNAHTLRVWEKRYGLLKPQRTETNIRYFLDQDLLQLQHVVSLYNHGVKISHIAEMSPEAIIEEARRIASMAENDDEQFHQALLHMNVTLMETLLDNSIKKHGFEETLVNLVLPTMEKMEVWWLAGTIDEAHEACFRELVKRKTIRETDLLPKNCKGPRVIMFLPKGNHQELNHLFMHYFLRRQGLCIIDMGCDINLDCACSAVQKCDSECVVIVNEDPVHWQFGPFIRNLVQRTSLPIIVSGRAADDDWSQYNGQVIPIDSIAETILFVSRLKENLQNSMS